jgi:hypothetical protein
MWMMQIMKTESIMQKDVRCEALWGVGDYGDLIKVKLNWC